MATSAINCHFAGCELKTSLAFSEDECCAVWKTYVSTGEKHSRSFCSVIMALFLSARCFLAPTAWEARSRWFCHLRKTHLPDAQNPSSIRTALLKRSGSRWFFMASMASARSGTAVASLVCSRGREGGCWKQTGMLCPPEPLRGIGHYLETASVLASSSLVSS